MRRSSSRPFKVIFLVCSMFLLLSTIAWAERATSDEMSRACRNWLTYIVTQKGAWGGSITPAVVAFQDIVVNDTAVARYFQIEPGGYVIVPILKDLFPIKAYSDQYQLDFNDQEGMSAMLKEVLTDRVRRFAEFYGSLDAVQPAQGDVIFGREQRQEWDKYLVSEDTFRASMTAKKILSPADVGPLLTTAWHQSAPYNNLCPMGDGGRCFVGCVATAAAQIMAYHKWPNEGTGTRSYYWMGDNSCGGNTPGGLLTADYTGPYDWANIPDVCGYGCTPEQQLALAHLNYDVGVAFSMMYGRCGSGAYIENASYVFPTYFRYLNTVTKVNRNQNGLVAWSDLIRTEIEANRPVQYGITSHSIVGDGWRQAGDMYQVHMNYGWGGSSTAWYTIDNLYCPWEGCSPMVEFMMTHIEPDRGLMISADTTWGFVPLAVSFTGSSPLQVDSWVWDFGDGDSAFSQNPSHSYSAAGRYGVTLQVTAGAEVRRYVTTNYINALADSLVIPNAKGAPNSEVVITVNARNTVPVRTLTVPISYSGSLAIQYDSLSTAGCRTSDFEVQKLIHFDPNNGLLTISLNQTSISTPELTPGSGPIAKLYFTIPADATLEQTVNISPAGYGSYLPRFGGSVLSYTPILKGGTVTLNFICGDANGNGSVNILDATYLISYLYNGGPPPLPPASADVNQSGSVNILDATSIIKFLYKNGPPLNCL